MPAVASHPRWQRALSCREVENGAAVEEDDLVTFVLSSSIRSLGILRGIGSIEFGVGEGRTNSSGEFPLSTFDLNEGRAKREKVVSTSDEKSFENGKVSPTHLSRPTSRASKHSKTLRLLRTLLELDVLVVLVLLLGPLGRTINLRLEPKHLLLLRLS